MEGSSNPHWDILTILGENGAGRKYLVDEIQEIYRVAP